MIAQNRNGEMANLLGADLLPLSDRNIYYSAYDSADQVFSDGNIQTLGYDTTHFTSSTEVFSLAADVLTVNYDGIFAFWHQIAVKKNTSTSDTVFTAWLERDSGAGYGEMLGTRIRMWIHPTEYITGSAMLITRVQSGYKYRVRAARAAGLDGCTVQASGRGMRWVCLVGLQ